MPGKEIFFKNVQKLIKGIQVLGIPVLWLEQNPQDLGPTIPEIADSLSDIQPIRKMSFSGCRNDLFLSELKALNRKQVLISGIETHVCVYQTAVDLVSRAGSCIK
jgi:nicotinamidase-related amidase